MAGNDIKGLPWQKGLNVVAGLVLYCTAFFAVGLLVQMVALYFDDSGYCWGNMPNAACVGMPYPSRAEYFAGILLMAGMVGTFALTLGVAFWRRSWRLKLFVLLAVPMAWVAVFPGGSFDALVRALARQAWFHSAVMPSPIPLGEAGSCVQGEAMYVIEGGESYGFSAGDGSVLLSPRYTLAMDFDGKPYAYADGYYIDATGAQLFQAFHYDNGPDYLVEGRRRYIDGDLVGFLDECLRVAVPARFTFAEPFRNGLALVCIGCVVAPGGEHRRMVGGQWGAVDRHGQARVPLEFDEAEARRRVAAHRR